MQQQTPHDVARAGFVRTGEGQRAYYATPPGDGPFPGVLVFQEAWGVNDYVQSEVHRLARHGYAAIAPDLFRGNVYSYDDHDLAPRLSILTDSGMLADVRAAMAHLDAQSEVKKGPYGAVGFCMGGRLAFLAAGELGDRIAAAACFYGGGIAPEPRRIFAPVIDRVPGITAEMLIVYGAEDDAIDPAEHGRIATALSTHKKAYTLAVYAGAKHGFASYDRTAVHNPQATELAWARTLALFDRTLKQRARS